MVVRRPVKRPSVSRENARSANVSAPVEVAPYESIDNVLNDGNFGVFGEEEETLEERLKNGYSELESELLGFLNGDEEEFVDPFAGLEFDESEPVESEPVEPEPFNSVQESVPEDIPEITPEPVIPSVDSKPARRAMIIEEEPEVPLEDSVESAQKPVQSEKPKRKEKGGSSKSSWKAPRLRLPSVSWLKAPIGLAISVVSFVAGLIFWVLENLPFVGKYFRKVKRLARQVTATALLVAILAGVFFGGSLLRSFAPPGEQLPDNASVSWAGSRALGDKVLVSVENTGETSVSGNVMVTVKSATWYNPVTWFAKDVVATCVSDDVSLEPGENLTVVAQCTADVHGFMVSEDIEWQM